MNEPMSTGAPAVPSTSNEDAATELDVYQRAADKMWPITTARLGAAAATPEFRAAVDEARRNLLAENERLRNTITELRAQVPQCNEICMIGADIGVPSAQVAYAHPACPLHGAPEVLYRDLEKAEACIRDLRAENEQLRAGEWEWGLHASGNLVRRRTPDQVEPVTGDSP